MRKPKILLLLAMGAGLPVLAWAQERHPPENAARAEPAHVLPAQGQGAADAHATPARQGDAHGEEAKPALLQFDPGAMIWTIIVFVVLLIVLRTVAWKPILRVLNERERFIQQSLADARTEREKAEQLRHSYEEQMTRARQDASKVVEEGRRDGEQVARRIQETARRDADELLQRAKREIQLATDTARKQLHDEVSDLAVRVARNIVRKELSAADHKALVEESLREMQSAGPRI